MILTSATTTAAISTANDATNKKISIMCLGSRGDFQPYLALALELKAAGFYVRLLSTVTFEKFAQDFGIDFVTIRDECIDKALREDMAVRAFLEGTGNMRKNIKSMMEMEKRMAPFTAKAFIDEMNNHKPDLLIYGSLCEYFGFYAKRLMNIQVLEIKLQPFVHNPKRALLGVPTLPFGLHYFMEKFIFGTFFTGWKNFDDTMEAIGSRKLLDVYTKKDMNRYMKMMLGGTWDVIICEPTIFKDSLAPQVSDSVAFVGPLIVNAKSQTCSDNSDHDKDGESAFGGDIVQKQIDDFINLKPASKPIYIGWGSMLCRSPEYMVNFAASTLQNCGERGIVLGGVAELSLALLERSTSDEQLIAFAKENILFVKKAAHEDLFPRMKCIVHHGGAGTTNAALRSGVPSIITPVILDQFDHAYVLNQLGVGHGFSKHLKKIKAKELSRAIENVVGSIEKKEQAREVGERMRKEDGNRLVVERIVKFLDEKVSDRRENDESLEEGKSTKERNVMANQLRSGSAWGTRKPWKVGGKQRKREQYDG